MVNLSDVISFLDKYLEHASVLHDNSWNGLQIEGKQQLNKIIFTVDSGIEIFNLAIAMQADMIVVHHGMFWQGINPRVVGATKERIVTLLEHGISLYASHLPLDKHPHVGNNAQLLKILGFKKDKPFAWYKGEQISFTGVTEQGRTIDQLAHILKETLGARCVLLPFGPKEIKTIALCSGGAGYEHLLEAITAGVDLYLAGEPIECFHTVKDANFNVIFAGHHATEIVGVKALSQIVHEKFGIQTEFIDVPTGF